MSGTAQAKAKASETTRKKYERNGVRPDAVDPNSARPKFGWLAQHVLYPSLAITLKALYSLPRTELPKGKGWLIRDVSIKKVAGRTARFIPGFERSGVGYAMPERTIGHCLERLKDLFFVVQWESEPRAKNSPFGTHLRLPCFDEILQRWADDPKIGTIRGEKGDKRAFYVIGKGRRHLTPEGVVAWKLDHALAQRLSSAQAVAGDVEEPLTANEAKGVTLGEEIDAVLLALHKEIQTGSGQFPIPGMDAAPEHAAKIIEIARDAVPEIPASAIGDLASAIRSEKWGQDKAAGKPYFCNVGWIYKGARAAAHAWRHRQRDRAGPEARSG